MNEMTDLVLVQLVQNGDEQAMAVIFDRHSGVIYSIALRVLEEPVEAENVLQEVLLAIWRNADRLLASGLTLGQWVALEARNLAVQTRRRHCPDADPGRTWSSATGSRRLLELAFFDGKTLSEICQLTGASPQAAKKGLVQAVYDLRHNHLRTAGSASGFGRGL